MRKHTENVLVLDGESRAALAIVRSLGKLGLTVGVATPHPHGIAAKSKYASVVFTCVDPNRAPDSYISGLSEIVKSWRPKMIFPASDSSLGLILRNETHLRQNTIIPTISKSTFDEVSNKASLLATAASLGISTPQTMVLDGSEESFEKDSLILDSFPYPAVIKPQSSVCDHQSHFVKEDPYYVATAIEARQVLSTIIQRYRHPLPLLVQEQIVGEGVGVFALCNRGKAVSIFCHRRILEKPPTGGRSVLSESISEQEAPIAKSLALLKHYNWSGVAMVEYKRRPNGDFVLMEVNPRFWGSLQLAINCNRDFPALTYRLFSQGFPANAEVLIEIKGESLPFAKGKRLRWCLGCLDHFLIRLKQSPLATIRDVTLNNSLQLFLNSKNTSRDVFSLSDLKPFFYEVKRYTLDLLNDK